MGGCTPDPDFLLYNVAFNSDFRDLFISKVFMVSFAGRSDNLGFSELAHQPGI